MPDPCDIPNAQRNYAFGRLLGSADDIARCTSRVSCRAELAGAIQDRKRKFPELTGCLFSIALERALGPLCDGVI